MVNRSVFQRNFRGTQKRLESRRESSHKVVLEIQELFGVNCRRNNIDCSRAMLYDSVAQQRLRATRLLQVSRQLKLLSEKGLARNPDASPLFNFSLDLAIKFFTRYGDFLEKELAGRFNLRKIGDSHTPKLPTDSLKKPLMDDQIDFILKDIIARVAAGYPPISLAEPSEDDHQEWLLARSFLRQIGWDPSVPMIGKTPIDLLFKTGNKNYPCLKVLSETTKQSMENLLVAWGRHSLDLDMKNIPGQMSFTSMDIDTKSSVRSSPTKTKMVTPSMTGIDLAKDIEQSKPVSLGLRNLFNSANRGLTRNNECGNMILDLYNILETYLKAVLPGGPVGLIQTCAQPLLLTLLLFFLRKKNKQMEKCTDLFDTMAKRLTEECNFPPHDPFFVEMMLENHYKKVKVSHSRYMRRNLVVEVLETLASNVVPGCNLHRFKCFDASLALQKTREMELRLEHLTKLLDKWLGTFRGDFGTLPPNSPLDKGLWGLTNTSEFLSPKTSTPPPPAAQAGVGRSAPPPDAQESMEKDEKLQETPPAAQAKVLKDSPSPVIGERVVQVDGGKVQVLDLETKILKGRKASLEKSDLFYQEGQYPFDVSQIIEENPDLEIKRKLLLKKLGGGVEGGSQIPLPIAWEALILRTLAQGTDSNKALGAWMVSKLNDRLKESEIEKLLPGCTYPFEGKWFTAAKKFAFHIFLLKGDMEENLLNTITGLNDLSKLMNKNFSIWHELPEDCRQDLKSLAPMFATLKPILTLYMHARKIIGYWKFMFEKHRKLLLNPPAGWEIGIQVARKTTQTKMFQNFPAQAYVRVAKSSQQQSGADKILTAFLIVRVIMDRAKISWNEIRLNTDAKVPRDLGPTLLVGYTWTMIAFLVSTTIATGLRPQNLSRTGSLNPSTLWTAATVLKRMAKESFDVETSEILSKNHQAGDIREIGFCLKGVYSAELDGVIPVQLLAIRLYMIRNWLLRAGLNIRETNFPLNDNLVFEWDKLQLKRQDWRREKPSLVTKNTWKSILDFVYESYLPEGLELQKITFNALRKMLITLESGAGKDATKEITGHKSSNSLDHYILAIPWLNRILSKHDSGDRPFLARMILNFVAEHIQHSGEKPDLEIILREYPLDKRVQLVQHANESEETGIIRQKKSLECVFWRKVLQTNPRDFSLSLDVFEEHYRAARRQVSEEACQKSDSDDDHHEENTATLPVHPEQGKVQREAAAIQEELRNGQEESEQDAVHHGGYLGSFAHI